MRTVLVTGGAGFIGSHLVDQLLESGTAVRVLDNLATGSLGNLRAAAERHSRAGGVSGRGRLEVIIGDVRDRELLRKALRNVKYVFHLAALPASAASVTDVGSVHSVNVEGTLNVLQGALTEGVWRVVFASCSSVYGGVDAVPVAETAPLRPTSLFGASKVAAETYCRAFHSRHQLDIVTLRYFNVYGPRQKGGPGGGVVASLVEAVRQRRALEDHDERSGDDFTYVDDAVAATLAAGRAPRAGGRVVNVGTGQMASVGDIVHILADLMKTDALPSFSPASESQPQLICADTAVAAELLDFSPRVSLIAGLARVVHAMGGERVEGPALAPVCLDD